MSKADLIAAAKKADFVGFMNALGVRVSTSGNQPHPNENIASQVKLYGEELAEAVTNKMDAFSDAKTRDVAFAIASYMIDAGLYNTPENLLPIAKKVTFFGNASLLEKISQIVPDIDLLSAFPSAVLPENKKTDIAGVLTRHENVRKSRMHPVSVETQESIENTSEVFGIDQLTTLLKQSNALANNLARLDGSLSFTGHHSDNEARFLERFNALQSEYPSVPIADFPFRSEGYCTLRQRAAQLHAVSVGNPEKANCDRSFFLNAIDGETAPPTAAMEVSSAIKQMIGNDLPKDLTPERLNDIVQSALTDPPQDQGLQLNLADVKPRRVLRGVKPSR